MYILVKKTITVSNTVGAGAAVNNTNKKVIFKNCAPVTNRISEINNTKVDDTIYWYSNANVYLIEYSDAHSKTSGSLWQYCRDELAPDNNKNIIDFPGNNSNSISFNFK